MLTKTNFDFCFLGGNTNPLPTRWTMNASLYIRENLRILACIHGKQPPRDALFGKFSTKIITLAENWV